MSEPKPKMSRREALATLVVGGSCIGSCVVGINAIFNDEDARPQKVHNKATIDVEGEDFTRYHAQLYDLDGDGKFDALYIQRPFVKDNEPKQEYYVTEGFVGSKRLPGTDKTRRVALHVVKPEFFTSYNPMVRPSKEHIIRTIEPEVYR